jgi:hypothetical protein
VSAFFRFIENEIYEMGYDWNVIIWLENFSGSSKKIEKPFWPRAKRLLLERPDLYVYFL